MANNSSWGSGVRLLVLLSSAIMGISLATPLRAEESEDNASGFRVRKPRIFIGGHLGLNMPRAGSDVFNMVTRELTLGKGDFRSTVFGADFGVPIGSNFAAVFSFEFGQTSPHSESRNFVEDNGEPVNQVTRFRQIPITATLRYYPRKTGETVGSYAWIPKRVLPYFGGGIGALHYVFNQSGRFVDNQTLVIFESVFHSSGFTTTQHVAAGVDISLSPLIFVNAEGRYSWANADLSEDFTGFQPINLSGFRLLGGIYFRF